MLTSYFEVVKYLRNTYATNDIFSEADVDIFHKQPKDLNAVDYSHSLWTNTLRCGPVYEDYRLKSDFIENLGSSIRQIIGSFCS